jgi:uncharacterized damage-inducible protein DinB
MLASEIELLLEMLDHSFNKRSWHGPNLRGSIRGVEVATAAWRPAPDRHNIWEQVVHAAYWKYVVRRRLLGEKRGSFALRGSNWFARPETATAAAWAADIALLEEVHESLRAGVAGLTPAQVDPQPRGGKVTARELVLGIAAHDVYHAGQIQLLKRLAASKPRSSSRGRQLA